MNVVMWTLAVESGFYVLVFLFLPVLKQKPVQLYTSIGSFFGLWYVLKRCDMGVIEQIQHYCDNTFLSPALTHRGFFPIDVIYLILGSLFYLWYAKKIKHISFVVLSVLFLILLIKGLGHYSGLYAVRVWLSYGLLVLSVYLNNRIPVPRWLVSFGNISYSVYLNHLVIGVILMNAILFYIGLSFSKFMFAFLAACLLAVLVSMISYKYIEVPSQRLARNLIREASSARFAVRVPLYVGSFVPFLMFLIYPLCKFLIFMCKVYL